jgi:hypothetical protein
MGYVIRGMLLTMFFLFSVLYLNEKKTKVKWKTLLFISTIILFAIVLSQIVTSLLIINYSLEFVPKSILQIVKFNDIVFIPITLVALIGLNQEINKTLLTKREITELEERENDIQEVVEVRSILKKTTPSFSVGLIFLVLYQIGLTAFPGIKIWYLRDWSESRFWYSMLVKSFLIFPISIITMVSMILVVIGLRKLTEYKKSKIVIIKILAATLIFNPILIDSLIEMFLTPRNYYHTAVFFLDYIYIVNGIIFLAFVIMLKLIQEEGTKRKKVTIKELVLPVILAGLLIVWTIIAIYKQIKLYPVPEDLGFYDYYYHKIRITSHVVHILYGITGFAMILELLIKSLIDNENII